MYVVLRNVGKYVQELGEKIMKNVRLIYDHTRNIKRNKDDI